MSIARIQVGSKLPNTVIKTMGKEGPVDVKVSDLFAKKRGVLFAVPGAFTPTCSAAHLPGFVEQANKIREKHNFDIIACLSVNDAFVMDAWGQQQKADTANIMMLADGNGDFTREIGMLRDVSAAGMGQRSFRYAMMIEDNEVKYLGVDDQKGQLEHSAAEVFLRDFPFAAAPAKE